MTAKRRRGTDERKGGGVATGSRIAAQDPAAAGCRSGGSGFDVEAGMFSPRRAYRRRRRSGRAELMVVPFDCEADMVAPALAAQSTWWRSTDPPSVIIPEIVGPDAIADLVAARFDGAALEQRRTAGIAPLTDQLALRVVLATRRIAKSSIELSELCRVGTSGIRKAVRRALDSGALISCARGTYRAHPDWRPIVSRTVAVELKLRDSMGALRQASAYKLWADVTWAVVANRPSESTVDIARLGGLGLATLCCAGSLRVWSRPPPALRTARSWVSTWVGEQLVARSGDHPEVTMTALPQRCRNHTST